VGSLWRFFRAQGFVYWAMCCYLLIEYVRPQQLFSPLNDVPVGVIVLGAASLAFLFSGRWFRARGVGTWGFLLFTAVIVASSVMAYEPGTAFAQWRLWFTWVLIYFLIINVVDTEQRYVFFLILWLVFIYYMAQGGAKQFAFRGFRFTDWGIIGAPGWFQNSGEFGVAMCMFLPVSWHFYLATRSQLTRWRKVFVLGMPVTAVIGIVGSSSRGALVGLAAVIMWSLFRGKRRLRAALGVAVLCAAVWLLIPPEQKARLSASGTDYTSQTRETYWKNGLDMLRRYPVLGVGYNNWAHFYADYYWHPWAPRQTLEGRIQLPHNIFIQVMAELGLAGLGAFLLMIALTLTTNYQTRKLARGMPPPSGDFAIHIAYGLDGAMFGYLASGFFVSVLFYPFFWINLALTVALAAIVRRQGLGLAAATASRHARLAARGPQPPMLSVAAKLVKP